MSRDWRLIVWGAIAGTAVAGGIVGYRLGNVHTMFYEGIWFGVAAYILNDTLKGDK